MNDHGDECGCPQCTCKHDRTELVMAISADIRGVGVDVSTYRCLDCDDVWSD